MVAANAKTINTYMITTHSLSKGVFIVDGVFVFIVSVGRAEKIRQRRRTRRKSSCKAEGSVWN